MGIISLTVNGTTTTKSLFPKYSKMTDQKIKHSRTTFFQNMKMAEKAMEIAKKSLTENNINNDIFDKVIEMKDCIKEIGNIVVELLIKSKETDIDIVKEESKKIQEEDKTG